MGNLFWKKDGWYIDQTDRVNVGDFLEIKQPDGTWQLIQVGKDSLDVFHPEPAGEPFNTGMIVRRKV